MIPSEAIVGVFMVGFLVGVFVGARYFDLVAPDEKEKP